MAVRSATQVPNPVPPIVASPNPISAAAPVTPISPTNPQAPAG